MISGQHPSSKRVHFRIAGMLQQGNRSLRHGVGWMDLTLEMISEEGRRKVRVVILSLRLILPIRLHLLLPLRYSIS